MSFKIDFKKKGRVWSWFEEVIKKVKESYFDHIVNLGNKENSQNNVKQKPISKSCKITQANNLRRRRRLSRKAQCLK